MAATPQSRRAAATGKRVQLGVNASVVEEAMVLRECASMRRRYVSARDTNRDEEMVAQNRAHRPFAGGHDGARRGNANYATSAR